MFATSCSPGPNNVVASYSGFNFGILKTIPHMLGVIFGFTILVTIMNFGLINIFQKLPILQEILKYAGSIFLLYLAYKISFSKTDPGHYRMFGWFQIGEIIKLGDDPSWYLKEKPKPSSHPHTIGKWKKNKPIFGLNDRA